MLSIFLLRYQQLSPAHILHMSAAWCPPPLIIPVVDAVVVAFGAIGVI